MTDITILIADDEERIADLLEIHLKKEGYKVLKAQNGREAIELIDEQQIDLLIMDIMMPEIDGYEATRRIREKHTMPIIFLSAKTSDFDKVHGLAIGADDYMTKPFTPIELVARVNAQLRRYTKFNHPATDADDSIENRGLMISKSHRLVTIYGEPVILTPKEFDILYLLASHPKKVFSMENIFENVWKEAYFESANTVMVHIRTLRKKLNESEQKDPWIKTVWGVGYAFNG